MAGSIAFTLSEGDYLNALRALSLAELKSWRPYRRIAVLLGGAVVILFALAMLVNWGDWVTSLAVAITGAVGGLVAYPFCLALNWFLIPRRGGKRFRQHASLHRPMEFTWNETGIGWKAERFAQERLWSEVHWWTEGRGMIMLYITDQMAELLPASAMTHQQRRDLLDSVARHGVKRR